MGTTSKNQQRAERLHAAGLCVRCMVPKHDRSLQVCPRCRDYIAAAAHSRRLKRAARTAFVEWPFDPYIETPEIDSPDWGFSGGDEFIELDSRGRPTNPDRNGGTKCMRPPNEADRDDRLVYGLPLRHTWRTFIGPAPIVDHGDWDIAAIYVWQLEQVRENHNGWPGGVWSDSEASGLSREIKKWRRRANGDDVRYNLFGNRPGGLSRAQTARLKHQIEQLKHHTGDFDAQ